MWRVLGALLVAAGAALLRPRDPQRGPAPLPPPPVAPSTASVRYAGDPPAYDAGPPRSGAIVAVFLLFALVAFSNDIIDIIADGTGFHPWDTGAEYGATVVAIDALLLGTFAVTSRRARRRVVTTDGMAPALRASRWWFLLGAVWILGLDFLTYSVLSDLPVLLAMATSLAFLPGLLVLLCFALDLDPWRAIAHRNDPHSRERLADVMAAIPLLTGTGAAYIGERLYGDTMGSVNQEYFSQVTQVIPLLLVALGLESRWFEIRRGSHPVRWGMTVYTVLILVIGEALAITALANDSEQSGPLYPWHEYTAFAFTLYACFVGLSALVLALLSAAPRRRAA